MAHGAPLAFSRTLTGPSLAKSSEAVRLSMSLAVVSV